MMKYAHFVAFILLVVGGLNWALWGLFGFDLVSMIGSYTMDLVAKAIYLLIGASAVYELVMHKKTCKECSMGGASAMPVSPSAGGGM
jgi:uncharacterized protein